MHKCLKDSATRFLTFFFSLKHPSWAPDLEGKSFEKSESEFTKLFEFLKMHVVSYATRFCYKKIIKHSCSVTDTASIVHAVL
jgi:hypothetical protein